MSKNAVIFPAFTLDYSGTEIQLLHSLSNQIDFKKYLSIAQSFSGIHLIDFDINSNNFLEDELKNQVLSYLFSCAYCDLLKEKKVKANYVSGFSMGIYAALYYLECISLETGLELILSAYKSVSAAVGTNEYGIGTVIGLDKNDIENIISIQSINAEFININGYQSFGITGPKNDIDRLIDFCLKEGAIHTGIMNVKSPYHSTYARAAKDSFLETLNSICVAPPNTIYISCINQHSINTIEQVRKELCDNLFSPLNWLATIESLVQYKVNTMYECGSGKSLYKLGKFIEGDFKIYPVNKWKKLF